MSVQERGPEPRNLVICSDGTGNRGGVTRGTNVWRIYQALKLSSEEPEQLVLYDDGVGTEDFKLLKLVGGATGYGLSENLRQMYEWLMLNYRPPAGDYAGDRIFLFGFSRGAYTVRSLAGILHHCGLVLGRDLEASEARAVAREVYGEYYRGSLWGRLLGLKSTYRRPLSSNGRPYEPQGVDIAGGLEVAFPPVCFLGVWDTVGAVGVPGWLQSIILLARSGRFHDVNANNWQRACHALAIDDERLSFWPEPLPAPRPPAGSGQGDGDAAPAPAPAEAGEQQVEQLWFAGAHSNVGGGYPKDGLAFVTLEWMMTHAEEAGLVFTAEAWAEVRNRVNPHDRVYDPRSGLRAYFRYKPREIAKIQRQYEKDNGPAAPLSQVHSSVLERVDQVTAGYAPPYLPGGLVVASTSNGVGGAAPEAVAALQGRLAASDGARIDRLRPVIFKTWVRKTLYWILLVTTLFVVGVAAFSEAGSGTAAPSPSSASEASAGSAERVSEWALGHVVKLVPDFLRAPVGRLVVKAQEYWWISLPLLALTILGLLLRRALKRRTVRDALGAWHQFRKPAEPDAGGAVSASPRS